MGTVTKDDLVTYYKQRTDYHNARAADESLKESERVLSANKARAYRKEIFRWMFMKDVEFQSLKNRP